jgi:hypothetical protein
VLYSPFSRGSIFWFCPSAVITQSIELPVRLLLKTMSRPLGENDGSSLLPWSWVRRVTFPLSTFTVKRSKAFRSSRAVKAMRSPRGDQSGVWL